MKVIDIFTIIKQLFNHNNDNLIIEMHKENTQNYSGVDRDEEIKENLYGLFNDVKQFKNSSTYFRYLKFIARFKNYSIFNTSLVFAQKPTVGYFATRAHWGREFDRSVKADARPLVMLQPKGPVMFAYDFDDTVGDDDIVPQQLLTPYKTSGEFNNEYFENLKNSLQKCYINLVWVTDAIVKAGKISRRIDTKNPNRPNMTITLNKAHDEKTNFVTLIHEVAHLLLGHLGNYNNALWPSRTNLDIRTEEFEAESVAYVLAGRLNLKTLSNEYLADYMVANDTIPKINIRQIGKTTEWIEQMIKGYKPRIFKPKKKDTE